jgi:hypothetical protein
LEEALLIPAPRVLRRVVGHHHKLLNNEELIARTWKANHRVSEELPKPHQETAILRSSKRNNPQQLKSLPCQLKGRRDSTVYGAVHQNSEYLIFRL